MKKIFLLGLVIAVAMVASAQNCHGQSTKMNFFITSVGPGKGADLGGLAGADSYCAQLAYRIGAGDLTWKAYLSTQATDNQAAVNARDRIGKGPFFNFAGDLVANNVAHLHSDSTKLGKTISVSEKGEVVNGRGDTPNRHDILTGSQLDGTAYPRGEDNTCNNWTSSEATGGARVGHHDRQGGGQNPTSWNSAHRSSGCGQQNLVSTGGNGLFYCFGIGIGG